MGWPGKDPRRVEPSDRGGGYGRLWEGEMRKAATGRATGPVGRFANCDLSLVMASPCVQPMLESIQRSPLDERQC